MEKPERSVYSPQDFQQWDAAGTLVLTPKFQRRGVWKTNARSFFIDTLLRQMPVPPIYIRLSQASRGLGLRREVIDGQQRISCVLDFISDKFRLSRSLDDKWAGKLFSELPPDLSTKIVNYSFAAEQFRELSDMQVLEIFARLNTYSVPLNAQELRNGRWFGPFKQSVYELGYEHLEFWRRHDIFKETSIARMNEVELTSELIIAQLDGMQDKKKSIDRFYEEFDSEYPQRARMNSRFRETIDVINEAFPDTLRDTEFSRAPLFYTLYCAAYHYRRGLKVTDRHLPESPRKALTANDRRKLNEAVRKLSEVIVAYREEEVITAKYETFVAACIGQTDNIRPRNVRLRALYEAAFG